MKNSTTRPGKNTPLFFYTQDYDMFIMRTMKVALSYHEENPHLTVGEIHEELISDIYRFLLLHVNELTEFFNKHGVENYPKEREIYKKIVHTIGQIKMYYLANERETTLH